MKNKLPVFFLVLLTLLIFGAAWFFYFKPKDNADVIIVRIRNPEQAEKNYLIFIDSEGNNIRYAGEYEGSPSWSPNGQSYISGCNPDLCLVNYEEVINRSKSGLTFLGPNMAIDKRIKVPEICQPISINGHSDERSGIVSTSWSPDGTKIVIVCGEYNTDIKHQVFIINLSSTDEELTQWDADVAENVFRAVWSPIDEDLIMITRFDGNIINPKFNIYLVDSSGRNPEFLSAGCSSEWSSDGEKVAFISEQSEGFGLAVINSDGTHKRWVEASDMSSFNGCYYFGSSCKLSWSPNNQYIVYSASGTFESYINKLFRIDVNTGEVVALLDPYIFDFPAEPSWRP